MAKKREVDQTPEPTFGAEDVSAGVSVTVAPLDAPDAPAASAVPNDCFELDGHVYRRVHERQPNGSWKDRCELVSQAGSRRKEK